jgi:uncharacterized protein (DUF488 family)
VICDKASSTLTVGWKLRWDFNLRIYTIGHSTRSIAEFIEMLQAHAVKRLVDVRTVPRSRHNPQYNREQLSAALERDLLGYAYMPGLGGFRHPRKGAMTNLGWRNLSFRGYADYMQTPEFAGQLQNLIAMAGLEQIAIMCAEAVPWRCHRSLIADALLVRNVEVGEIASATQVKPFTLHPFAQVKGTQVSYPGLPLESSEADQ